MLTCLEAGTYNFWSDLILQIYAVFKLFSLSCSSLLFPPWLHVVQN